mgnify:FL=1|jgi:hypothetical protein|tara:strand:- start:972 stop:1220 length:249 start_codon:yes stop_codon:yes gene_type:complete
MDIGIKDIVSIVGGNFFGSKDSSGGETDRFELADFYSDLRSTRPQFQSTPLEGATEAGMPQQISYAQTRQFWNGLLSEYLRS